MVPLELVSWLQRWKGIAVPNPEREGVSGGSERLGTADDPGRVTFPGGWRWGEVRGDDGDQQER